jgi:hypothetical protein
MELVKANVETIATSQSDMKIALDYLNRKTMATETSILILQSFLFPRMHDRRILIEESHPKTFS